MNHKRMTALLLAGVLAVGSLTACGKEEKKQKPVNTPSVTTTTAVAPTAAPIYYVTASSLYVRSAPDGEKIGSLFQGDVVEVLGVEGDWCRIRYDGGEAYIHKDYVGTKEDVTTTTQEVTTTTNTTTTTKKPTTTTQPPKQYDDRYIDAAGMLQFNPAGNYVQANSYNGATIPWNLLLVNDWNPMKEGYDEAVTMKSVEAKYAQVNGGQKVDARMYDDLVAMLEAGKAYNIGVQSSYRPYATQKRLYWNQVEKWKNKYSDPVELQTKAGEVVKRPGFSEHNTGLAVDLYGSGDTSLSPSFANTAAYKWLMEHCADYGFILRFPKGKESITGVIYEAWHFRYVGDPDIAHAIMDNGLCLEEYLAQQKK